MPRQDQEAFDGLKVLLDKQPSAPILNNLGVVQVRRGSTPSSGRATYFFNKAREADQEDEDYLFNLGYAYWLEKDPQAAVYWLKNSPRWALPS